MKKETKLIIVIIVITVAVILFVRYRRAQKAVSSGQTNYGGGFFKPDLEMEPNGDVLPNGDLFENPIGDVFENPASGSSGSIVNSGKILR